MKEDAIEINVKLKMKSPVFFNSLSKLGKRLYMPKGIIFQSSQSTQHANKFNASIGIAIENIGFDGTNEIQAENLGPMVLSSLKLISPKGSGQFVLGLTSISLSDKRA